MTASRSEPYPQVVQAFFDVIVADTLKMRIMFTQNAFEPTALTQDLYICRWFFGILGFRPFSTFRDFSVRTGLSTWIGSPTSILAIVLSILRDAFNGHVDVSPRSDGMLQLGAPFFHTDGNLYDMFIDPQERDGMIRVTDRGEISVFAPR